MPTSALFHLTIIANPVLIMHRLLMAAGILTGVGLELLLQAITNHSKQPGKTNDPVASIFLLYISYVMRLLDSSCAGNRFAESGLHRSSVMTPVAQQLPGHPALSGMIKYYSIWGILVNSNNATMGCNCGRTPLFPQINFNS